jgi:hypothetical protein
LATETSAITGGGLMERDFKTIQVKAQAGLRFPQHQPEKRRSSWNSRLSRHTLNIWIFTGTEAGRVWVSRAGECNAVTRRRTKRGPCYRLGWIGQIVRTESVPTYRNSDPPCYGLGWFGQIVPAGMDKLTAEPALSKCPERR